MQSLILMISNSLFKMLQRRPSYKLYLTAYRKIPKISIAVNETTKMHDQRRPACPFEYFFDVTKIIKKIILFMEHLSAS